MYRTPAQRVQVLQGTVRLCSPEASGHGCQRLGSSTHKPNLSHLSELLITEAWRLQTTASQRILPVLVCAALLGGFGAGSDTRRVSTASLARMSRRFACKSEQESDLCWSLVGSTRQEEEGTLSERARSTFRIWFSGSAQDTNSPRGLRSRQSAASHECCRAPVKHSALCSHGADPSSFPSPREAPWLLPVGGCP